MLGNVQKWLTAPLLLAVMLVFFFQTQACLSEELGLTGCAMHQDGDGQSKDSSLPLDSHCECPGHLFVALAFHEVRSGLFGSAASRIFNPDESCPDGPAGSIDLPPQLS